MPLRPCLGVFNECYSGVGIRRVPHAVREFGPPHAVSENLQLAPFHDPSWLSRLPSAWRTGTSYLLFYWMVKRKGVEPAMQF